VEGQQRHLDRSLLDGLTRILSAGQYTLSPVAFDTQLNDYKTGELLEAARYVRDLEGRPGWQLLTSLVEVEVERVQTRMIAGNLPSYEKLAELRGELRGLKALTDAAQAVLDAAQEREAEEQARVEEVHV
jgi:hypothetical protein